MEGCVCESGLIPAEKPECPQCGRLAVVIPILYGLPNLDAIQLEKMGKLEWGSRFYKTDSPCWRCKTCGLAFGND